MFGRAVAERASRHDRRLPRRPGLPPRGRPDRVVARHRHPLDGRRARSWPATRCSGRSARSQHRADAFNAAESRAGPGAGRPCRGRHGECPAHRGARPFARASWPRAPTSSARCARSPRGSARRPTCRPCSSGAVDEAVRLLDADGARIDLVDAATDQLSLAPTSRATVRPGRSARGPTPTETIDQGVAGQAVVRGRAVWTGDYLADSRSRTATRATRSCAATGIRSVMAAPLIGESGPFGALTVVQRREGRLGRDGRRAARSPSRTRRRSPSPRPGSSPSSANRARPSAAAPQAEQALREIAARITVLRDPTRSSATSSIRRSAWSARTA